MFKAERQALKKITTKLRKSLGDELIAVVAFGSRVRGDFNGDSDFDVLVIVKNRKADVLNKVVDIFQEFELKTSIPFSPIVKSLNTFEKEKTYKTGFYRNIESEGVVLYGKT